MLIGKRFFDRQQSPFSHMLKGLKLKSKPEAAASTSDGSVDNSLSSSSSSTTQRDSWMLAPPEGENASMFDARGRNEGNSA